MTLQQAIECIGKKVRYTAEASEVIPKRGAGTIVSVNSSVIIVQWDKLRNACYPEHIEIVGIYI
jgi:hypothetical protein